MVYRIALLLLLIFLQPLVTRAQNFSFVENGKSVMILYDKEATKLDSISAHLLAEDIQLVTGSQPKLVTEVTKANGNIIVVGHVGSNLVQRFVSKSSLFYQKLQGKWECFGLKVVDRPMGNIAKALVIAGSDARGTAYGVFTISEKIGVSPWYWWADVPVKQQKQITITQSEFVSVSPAVKYRGIFINDEDWGLQPWAAKNFEPETGDIGPKTYAKVFELLLRLKANLIWPAMHPSTKAFFHYPANLKTAEDYQIIIGSSHAEPMLRNNVGEWDEKTMGHFNYLTNKDRVYQYWESRIKESSGINAIYTMGMRGVHDGQMEGVKDLQEAVPLVERIMQDERDLLAKYVNKDVSAIPQVLTPYKEVLEIYDNGLKVPEDITLVWPDDNYGYIQRLNNEKERARKGGGGVYYHASYWGRPHDYLWLPSAHPSLMTEEMMKAYENGSSRLWVLNVGDIKPQEYNIQQFLDMAYNPAPFKDSRYTKQHLLQWATAIFGKEKGRQIQSLLWEYYRLAFERRPEFMGWSQTEPETKTTYTDFNHFYFGDEAQKRIDSYNALETAAKKLRPQISPKAADAFYQLVYYPVIGAAQMNKKFLFRDKSYFYAGQNRLSAYEYAQRSKNAFDSIVKETEFYNTQLTGGKWKGIMSMNPRNLFVYQAPVMPVVNIDSAKSWSVAPEGFVTKDSSLTEKGEALSLPAFDQYNKQKYFVDIFLQKHKTVQWAASVSQGGIRLSQNNGLLSPEQGKAQVRIWVDIDWSKMNKKEQEAGNLIFTGDGQQIVIKVPVNNVHIPELSDYQGFIENNGFVCMYASDFSRQTVKQPSQWKVIDGLGYTGKVLQALPLTINTKSSTDPDSVKAGHSFVAYDFYTFSSAEPMITVLTLPTHPLNNNYGMRYAVSIDEGTLKIVDFKTYGRSEEWKQNVLRNRAERRIQMPMLSAGKHTLKIYCIDPGVVLDEVRIDLGGLKNAYSTIPETKVKGGLKEDFGKVQNDKFVVREQQQ